MPAMNEGNGYIKINVRPGDRARFKVIAAALGIDMAELFASCVDDLETKLPDLTQMRVVKIDTLPHPPGAQRVPIITYLGGGNGDHA